jgi:hypothetical protein
MAVQFVAAATAAGNLMNRPEVPGSSGAFSVWSNRMMPRNWVDLDTATQLWLNNWLTTADYKEINLTNGVETPNITRQRDYRYTSINAQGVLTVSGNFMRGEYNPYEKSIAYQNYYPTIDESITLYRRKLIDRPLFDFILDIHCKTDRNWALAFADLRYEIPGSSDLVRFAVREAFSPDIVSLYQYNKELPREVLPWMEKQGYGQPLGFNRPDGSTWNDNTAAGGSVTWFDLYWYSHWELPSVTQGYDMLHRFYADSSYGPSPSYTPGTAFDFTAMSTLLKTQDYPPYWREKLISLSYSPLTRVDIRRMFDIGVLNDAGVYHGYRALGYDDNNAKNLLQFTKQLKKNRTDKPRKRKNNQTFCKYYSAGVIDGEELRRLLAANGLEPEEIEPFVRDCDLELRMHDIQSALSSIKTSYMSGAMEEWEARAALSGIGVKRFREDMLITLWARQLTFIVRNVSAKEAISLYKDGIMREDELVRRLQNLKYENADVQLMVTQARYSIIKDIQKRRMADEKQRLKELQTREAEVRKALTDQRKAEERTTDERVKGFISAGTDKNILAWYKAGLISRTEIIDRLKLKKWTDVDIARWMQVNLDPIDKDNEDEPAPEEKT